MTWFLYIAMGRDGSLYTGISTDPERRIREHNSSKRGSKWARGRRPVCLVSCYAAGETRSEAQKEEARVKRLPRAERKDMVLFRGIVPRGQRS